MFGFFVSLKCIFVQIKVLVCLDKVLWCIDRSNEIVFIFVIEVFVLILVFLSVDMINKRLRLYIL